MRTGGDISPLLDETLGSLRRPPYLAVAIPGAVAAGLMLVAAAALGYDAYFSTLNVPSLVAMGLAVVSSLVWLHRAYRNLAALGVPKLRDSPASAVAWFLVPVANWLLTYPVLRDLWVLSDRADRHQLGQGSPVLVQFWRLFWAAPPVASILSLLFFERPGPGSASARAQALVSFDFACLAAAAVLGAAVIMVVTSRQEQSHRLDENQGDAGL